MGCNFGWIVSYVGLVGGVEEILIVENIISVDKIVENLKNLWVCGKISSIIIMVEG